MSRTADGEDRHAPLVRPPGCTGLVNCVVYSSRCESNLECGRQSALVNDGNDSVPFVRPLGVEALANVV